MLRLKPAERTNRGVETKGLRGKRVRITVKGELKEVDGYSRHLGRGGTPLEAYELAEIHALGLHGPKRPFLARIRDAMNGEYNERLNKKIKSETRLYKRTGKFETNWDAVGDWMVKRARTLMKSGKLGLEPLKKETLKRRKSYGYTGGPLYASGMLADCITWETV